MHQNVTRRHIHNGSTTPKLCCYTVFSAYCCVSLWTAQLQQW